MNGHFYSNRYVTNWLRLCADLEHADPGDRFEEDFKDIFEDDKSVDRARQAAEDLADLMPDYLEDER